MNKASEKMYLQRKWLVSLMVFMRRLVNGGRKWKRRRSKSEKVLLSSVSWAEKWIC